jgi:hypothetical protein
MNRARRRIPLGTSAARRLQQLSARTSRQRQGQFRAELEERRQFEDLGLDHEAVQRARAAAYLEAMAGVMEERREPYQLEIPGIKATLMSLRSREPMTDDEARAMGIVLPIEPVARGPAGEQMEMNFDAPTAANQITLLPRQVTGESVSDYIDQLPRLREQPRTSKAMRALPPGNTRMAGDPAIQAMALSILLGGAATGAYGLYDAATGEESGIGELAMNYALTGLPGLGFVGGVAGAIAADPASRAAADGSRMWVAKAKEGKPPTAEEMASFMQAANAAAAQRMKQNPGMSRQEAVALAGKRGKRNLMGGALAGTLAGGIPAIMLMQDSSREQEG